MSRGFLFKHFWLLILACLFSTFLTGQQVMLQPHFSVLEDRNGSVSADAVLKHPAAMIPLDSLRNGISTSYYWLRTELHTDSPVADPDRVLSFHNLTYVDVYLYQGDSLLVHKMAGVFRKRSAISEFDGRQFTVLPLEPGKTYTLLLQVHHT